MNIVPQDLSFRLTTYSFENYASSRSLSQCPCQELFIDRFIFSAPPCSNWCYSWRERYSCEGQGWRTLSPGFLSVTCPLPSSFLFALKCFVNGGMWEWPNPKLISTHGRMIAGRELVAACAMALIRFSKLQSLNFRGLKASGWELTGSVTTESSSSSRLEKWATRGIRVRKVLGTVLIPYSPMMFPFQPCICPQFIPEFLATSQLSSTCQVWMSQAWRARHRCAKKSNSTQPLRALHAWVLDSLYVLASCMPV